MQVYVNIGNNFIEKATIYFNLLVKLDKSRLQFNFITIIIFGNISRTSFHSLAGPVTDTQVRLVYIKIYNAESDNSHAEEETALHLPPELAELFRSEEFNGFSDLK